MKPAEAGRLSPDHAPPTTERPPLLTAPFVRIWLSTLAYFIGIGATLPILPRYVKGPLGGTSFSVGLVVGSFSLTAFFLRPLAGRLGDRRGRRLLTVGGASVVALSIAGYTVSASLPPLIGFRLLTGAGEAFFFTGSASAINDVTPDERRGETVSLFSLALYVGLAVGPLLAEPILGHGGYHHVWWMAAAASAVAAALVLWAPNTGAREEGAERSPGPLVNRAALMPGIVLSSNVWGFSAFVSFVPLYALQLGLSGSRYVFLGYALIIIAVRGLGARLPDRLGEARTSRFSIIVSIVGLTVMATWHAVAGLYAGAVIFAVGQALLFPGLMTLAIRSAPPEELGSVVGTFTAFFDLSYGLGAVSLGAVASVFGYRGAFAMGAMIAAVGLALLLIRQARERSRTVE